MKQRRYQKWRILVNFKGILTRPCWKIESKSLEAGKAAEARLRNYKLWRTLWAWLSPVIMKKRRNKWAKTIEHSPDCFPGSQGSTPSHGTVLTLFFFSDIPGFGCKVFFYCWFRCVSRCLWLPCFHRFGFICHAFLCSWFRCFILYLILAWFVFPQCDLSMSFPSFLFQLSWFYLCSYEVCLVFLLFLCGLLYLIFLVYLSCFPSFLV